jgi:hypothetical protein
MIRISPELKEKVLEKAEENNCTMTSYLEYLINQDLEEKPKWKPFPTKRKKLS